MLWRLVSVAAPYPLFLVLFGLCFSFDVDEFVLQAVEGVSDLKVQIVEGIASVEVKITPLNFLSRFRML